jgi:hypothetical protein
LEPILRFVFILLSIALPCHLVQAQTILSGRVSNSKGAGLASANLSVLNENNDQVSGFTICDAGGNFTLQVKSSADSIRIRISRLGYEMLTLKLPNQTQLHQFVLEEKSIKLKELTVKGPAVIIRKDTIDYQVNAFKTGSDRTISDVLKRMPGLEVLENGQILYQGNAIEKYYINGMDLLEGRYNLANNNMPADAVRKVQIMENDQPIKILKSKVFSDKTSLNIQLKKFTTTGSAQVGVGLSPMLWKVNVTPMTFSKNFQVISSYQTNNVGTDISKELVVLTSRAPEKPLPALLNIQQLSPPQFQTEKWLDNNSHLLSTNLIRKTKNETELKLSVALMNDRQKQNGETRTTFITPSAKIDIDESKRNAYQTKSLLTNLVVEKNTNRIYIKNTINVQQTRQDATGDLVRNQNAIYQRLTNDKTQIENNFSAITSIRKQLMHITSQTSYRNAPQRLTVTPGQFISIFNSGIPFQSIVQNVALKEFRTNNSLGFTRQFRKFTFTPLVGVNLQNHHLDSWANVIAEDTVSKMGTPFQNDFTFRHLTIFAQNNSHFESKKWAVDIFTPVRQHAFRINDFSKNKKLPITRLTFEPAINVRYRLTDFTDLSSNSSFSNDFGNPSQLYSAYILRSYRNLQRLDGILTQNSEMASRLGVNYKNPLSLIFLNLGYTISRLKQNLQYRNTIDSSGAITLGYVLKDNYQNNHLLDLGVGKYFGDIKTSVKLNGSASFNNSRQIINDVLSRIRNKSYRAGLFISTAFNDRFNISLMQNTYFLINKVADQKASKSNFSQYQFDIDIFPASSQTLQFKTEYYTYSGISLRNQLYINLLYRYTFGKKKLDLELNCTNLTNTRLFTSITNLSYTSTSSNFQLRPRQILLSLRLPF